MTRWHILTEAVMWLVAAAGVVTAAYLLLFTPHARLAAAISVGALLWALRGAIDLTIRLQIVRRLISYHTAHREALEAVIEQQDTHLQHAMELLDRQATLLDSATPGS